ncbi:Adenosylhomocysteine nucleosidase [Lachnoclostridium phytofermentans ISDg]|uniref:adenosylhomocysteine nucleosidase n=2 Tax=Lachnoclostridium phytofermentans TaxID=66219 RepID=A9KK85_LACP7|nr:Adenosylhomocysteine nucleosidase [Lachnoclostridium phytofermentans ISDg]
MEDIMIGIIGAMDEEVTQLKNKMQQVTITKKAGMDFYSGNFGDRAVVIVRSGIGKVNASICTQVLVDEFHASAIINTGIAGSLNNDINIGDIVLSTDALQHDVDAVAFGYKLGVIPRMETSIFKADEKLLTKAERLCKKVNPDISVFKGRIVTGDQFIANKDQKDRLVTNFSGFCTEMEGAAIAQAAYLNQIPFLIIRAISDKADNSATVDYPTFEAKAIEHTVNLVTALIPEI